MSLIVLSIKIKYKKYVICFTSVSHVLDHFCRRQCYVLRHEVPSSSIVSSSPSVLLYPALAHDSSSVFVLPSWRYAWLLLLPPQHRSHHSRGTPARPTSWHRTRWLPQQSVARRKGQDWSVCAQLGLRKFQKLLRADDIPPLEVCQSLYKRLTRFCFSTLAVRWAIKRRPISALISMVANVAISVSLS